MLEMPTTPTEMINAPMHAMIPTKLEPRAVPMPKSIAEVAPRDAPEDIPRTYGGKSNSVKLLLAGMALSAVCSAFSNLIIYFAHDKEGIESITYWMMGSMRCV